MMAASTTESAIPYDPSLRFDEDSAPMDYDNITQLTQILTSISTETEHQPVNTLAEQPVNTLAAPVIFEDADWSKERLDLGRLLPTPTLLETFKLHYRYSKGKVDYWDTYLKELGVKVNIGWLATDCHINHQSSSTSKTTLSK